MALCSSTKSVCNNASPIQNPGSFDAWATNSLGSMPSGSTRSLPSSPERTLFLGIGVATIELGAVRQWVSVFKYVGGKGRPAGGSGLCGYA